MRTLTIIRHGHAEQAFELRENATPQPAKDQLLIRVEGFGLNFADIMARQGLYREAPPIPFVPGYEVVGDVIRVGDQVQGDLLGKRVVAFTRFGGYADHALANYRACTSIGSDMSGAVACALATQYCTAYYMTDYSNRLRAGEVALIHAAAGGVGTALVQLCKRKGLKVAGLCSTDEKCEYLREQGVDLPINYKTENYAKRVEQEFGTRSVDYIFNATMGRSFSHDRQLLNYGGKLFCYGGASRSGSSGGLATDLAFLVKTGFFSPLFMMMQSQSFVGLNMLRLADHKIEAIGTCLSELVALYTNAEISPRIGREYSYGQIAEAHAFLESGTSVGKVYVSWDTA